MTDLLLVLFVVVLVSWAALRWIKTSSTTADPVRPPRRRWRGDDEL